MFSESVIAIAVDFTENLTRVQIQDSGIVRWGLGESSYEQRAFFRSKLALAIVRAGWTMYTCSAWALEWLGMILLSFELFWERMPTTIWIQ